MFKMLFLEGSRSFEWTQVEPVYPLRLDWWLILAIADAGRIILLCFLATWAGRSTTLVQITTLGWTAMKCWHSRYPDDEFPWCFHSCWGTKRRCFSSNQLTSSAFSVCPYHLSVIVSSMIFVPSDWSTPVETWTIGLFHLVKHKTKMDSHVSSHPARLLILKWNSSDLESGGLHLCTICGHICSFIHLPVHLPSSSLSSVSHPSLLPSPVWPLICGGPPGEEV